MQRSRRSRSLFYRYWLCTVRSRSLPESTQPSLVSKLVWCHGVDPAFRFHK
jgi:hypothetical protein